MPQSTHTTPEDLFVRFLTYFSGSSRYFTVDMAMADVVTSEFLERDLWLAVCAFEISIGVDVPQEMLDLGKLSMTIGEFAQAVTKLPKENDELQIARFIRALVAAMESPDQDEDEVPYREEESGEEG